MLQRSRPKNIYEKMQQKHLNDIKIIEISELWGKMFLI